MNAISGLNSQRLLCLVKAALHDTTPADKLFINTLDADWQTLFEHSALQGVMVLTFYGAMRLPQALQPPHALKMRWIASVESVEKRYGQLLETANDIADFFKENHIRMLLFKGLALSKFYPVPGSREFGDLDIFLFGKAKEGNALLNRITGKSALSAKKHDSHTYRGIVIENHHSFLNHGLESILLHSETLEKRLLGILANAGISGEPACPAYGQSGANLLFPPPDFDVLFVTLHILANIPVRMVLRYFCDLTVLFTAYKGIVDFSFYRNTLSEAGLIKPVNAIISLSVRYLGLNPAYAPPYESDKVLEDRLWNELLNPAVTPPPLEKRNIYTICKHKIRLFRSNRWKYELIYPGNFRKRIRYSVLFHCLHPTSIFKIR